MQPPFRPRPEHELVRLADEALLGHVAGARQAGDRVQADLALRVLVFAHWDRVARRIALKVDRNEVETVAGNVMLSVMTATFDGERPEAFVAWLNTITDRRIADHHRRRAAEPATVALATGGAGEHDDGRATAAPEPADRGEEGVVETQDLLERVLATLNDQHRAVVERHVLDGVPAREVADELGVGVDNVAQIASRFRRRLREALSNGEDG